MKRYLDEDWVKSMKITYDFNNMMHDTLGSEGISPSEIDALAPRLKECVSSLKHKRDHGLDWMNLPYSQMPLVDKISSISNSIKDNFDNFIVLGIGGQALGPICVHEALNHSHYNELPKEKRNNCPRFYVLDNVDPERINALFDIIDIEKTKFFISSKSGNTSETISQLLIITNYLKEKLRKDFKNNIICLTNSKNGSLLEIVKKEGYEWLDMPEGVGGRYSELSASGLLPAAVTGIDIAELLAGAGFMDELCSKADVYQNPALMGAVTQFIAMNKGKNIGVVMPYSHALRYIADWYAQLWAESLGKRLDIDNNEIFAGQTPVKALGVTDQHSQIQLYTEGPFDKVITFIRVNKFRNEMIIPKLYENINGVSFLSDHTMGELINTEEYATEYALVKAKRINNTITLPEINAFTVGQLIYLLEMQTAFAGELLRINAFNQPGVEEGKIATFALLGREGFESKKDEMNIAIKKNPAFVI